MASVCNDPNGKRIVFTWKGKRPALHLGKVSKQLAESIKIRVEAIVASNNAALPLDAQTATWLGGISDDLHDKLAGVGLVPKRQRATLKEFLDGYLAERTNKPRTLINLRQCAGYLTECFGDRPLTAFTPDDPSVWIAWMAERYGQGTIGRAAKTVKHFFRVAHDRGLTQGTPFGKLKGSNWHDASRKCFVTRETVDRIVAAASPEWKRIIALVRYGGLRCPSEVRALKWSDFKADRFYVTSPKTEHLAGGAGRWVPLFPELQGMEYNSGPAYVVSRTTRNWRPGFEKLLKKAGVKPWPKLFVNLRASRETELCELFPAHVVAAWLGHSPAVQAKHYLQVTDEHFNKAARLTARRTAPESAEGVQDHDRAA